MTIAVAVCVDTLVPLGSRSGLGVRRGAVQRTVAALFGRRRAGAPADDRREGAGSGRSAEPAGYGLAVAAPGRHRAWSRGPARTGRPRRAAVRASSV
ncbi:MULTISPECIES: hypothetical protein [unclassified Nocardiopsis]|uniref:hypothetical protein n=1 Tax=unclassified Nocardiopsis TaxID=2649073 RepID=UPI001F5C074D|nr:hypothetical protein [Nocardiopsis sp. TSRI0078]